MTGVGVTRLVRVCSVVDDLTPALNELIRLRNLYHRGEQVFGVDLGRVLSMVPRQYLPDHERKRIEAEEATR